MIHAKMTVSSRALRRLMLSTAVCLLPSQLMAQEAPVTPGADTAKPASEEIIVTGSRIRGVAPVGSSVVAISAADISASGATTTTELIQQVPQVFNLGVSETSRGQSGGSSNVTYGSTVNLRGIGPYTTLSIIDGHRVVPQGTSGFAVDPSVIPTLGLERVDIVADGASAIYGSDAIAGVVNLVLRRNFEGLRVSARQGFGDQYRERQVGFVAGHRWDTGQFTFAFENAFHTALNGRDRDFYRGDLTGRGGTDFRPTACNPGTITLAGTTYAIPAGGVTAANRAALVAGTVNRCDNLKIADLIPRQNRFSGSFTFNQEVAQGVRIFADGYATRRKFKIYAGASNSVLNVPSTNPYFVAPPGTTPTSETVAYSFINDFPQTYNSGYSEALNLNGGVTVNLPFHWKFEGNYGWGKNFDYNASTNVVNNAAVTAAVNSTNPATALNVFGGPNSPALVSSLLTGVNVMPGRVTFQSYEAKLDGPIFSLPGGEVRVALGYEGQNLKVKQGQINGTLVAPVDLERYFGRKVDSFYGEVLIPLFDTGNAIPGFYKLDIDAAVRRDKYSDVGSTTNPKVGVNWSPIRELTLRGSYGTSFRAPTISQIYGNSNAFFIQNYSDPTCGCTRVGVTRSGANLNIKPETARTWSLGADFEPTSRLKASLTYWNVDYTNQVTSYLSDLTILQREGQFAGTNIIVRNPSAALIAQQQSEINAINGVLPNPITLFVDGRNNNLGKTKASGLDFQVSYRMPTSIGAFALGLNGTYFLNYKVAITPSAPLLNMLNVIFNPIRFRARGSVGWKQGPFEATVFVNYENKYTNNLSVPVQTVRAYKPVDLYVGYTFPADHGVMKDLKFVVDVKNLFNEKPPFVNIVESANGGGGFDPTLANPIGRVVSVAIDKKF